MSSTKKLWALLVVLFTHLGPQVNTCWADPVGRQPMVQTPMSRTELLDVLRQGHLRVFGELPGNNRLAMAWGQVAFENGHGQLTYNNNLGNVVAVHKQTAYYLNAHRPYRAFATAVDGAAAYWEVLQRCTVALRRFDMGWPVDAAAALKRCGYFEADLASYTRGFVSLYRYAVTTVMAEEKHEQQQQQEHADAVHDELVELIDRVQAARDAQGSPSGH